MTNKEFLEYVEKAIKLHHPDPDGVIASQDKLSEFGQGAATALTAFRDTLVNILPRER